MKNASFKTFNPSDIEKLKAIGVDDDGCSGDCPHEGSYHVVDSTLICSSVLRETDYDTVDDYIASLESSSEYPKVMLVGNANDAWYQRVVFTEKCGKFLAWNGAKTLEESEKVPLVSVWDHAKDLPTTIKMTLQEVQEKLGIDNLEIL